MNQRYVHLSPRLSAALELLADNCIVADIGCDHGRLSASLLQQHICSKIIASDVSADSLQKAKQLIGYIGLREQVSFRVGDGLSVLQEGEADSIAMLGMGGTLMARILDAAPVRLMGASSVVLQPMRAQDDIRAYLYRNRYHIMDDRIVKEGQRLYQILRAVPQDSVQEVPDFWPKDFFDLGFVSFLQRDPLFTECAERQLEQHRKRLLSAAGTVGEGRLRKKIVSLKTILERI